jgi:hypothetical protein
MLERPEDLMKKPPYHLILTHNQYGKFITIQCSHQPSLELIADYFKKWTKKNHNQSNKVYDPEAFNIPFNRAELSLAPCC